MNKIINFLSQDPYDFYEIQYIEKLNEMKKKEFVENAKKVHYSEIPNKIRNTEMKFNLKKDFSDLRVCTLDKKVNTFLNWYCKNIIKVDMQNKFMDKRNLVNLIEKLAVWYEIAYPDEYFECKDKESYLSENKYICDFNKFLNTLSCHEIKFLDYPKWIRYNLKDAFGFLDISKNGTIETREVRILYFEPPFGKALHINTDFNGLNLIQAKALMKEYDMKRDVIGIQEIIDNYQIQVEAHERLLDCVMYRIIERGDSIGPFRGYMFAKEFNRNIEVPIMYMNANDSVYLEILCDYIKNGGNINLKCFNSYLYYDRENNRKKGLETFTVAEILEKAYGSEYKNINHEEPKNAEKTLGKKNR